MLNHIDIMGRLVANPELRHTGNGIPVCSFRIACDRNNPPEGSQKADFIDCVAWRKTGEFVQKYFIKGKPILISGRLQIRDWTDKDGNARKATEIVVEEAHFCGGDKVQKPVGYEQPPLPPTPPEFTELGSDDDLPWKTDTFDDIADLP